MASVSKTTFAFLKQLKANNNREWFTIYKAEYEKCKVEFESFIDDVIKGIAVFDPSVSNLTAKNCVFRIYRDVRFSKDKSPYKTHLGAHISPVVKKSEIHSRAGYYVHLEPGASMLAGGAYLPAAPWLKAIRQEIAYNHAEFEKILASKSFKTFFGQMEGETLKSVPKEFSQDYQHIGWLKHKSFLAVNRCSDKVVTDKDFIKHCIKTFKALQPFDAFLNRALD